MKTLLTWLHNFKIYALRQFNIDTTRADRKRRRFLDKSAFDAARNMKLNAGINEWKKNFKG